MVLRKGGAGESTAPSADLNTMEHQGRLPEDTAKETKKNKSSNIWD
jgi:hypothetical protein